MTDTKTALIVVDAWDSYWEWDLEKYPFIPAETKTFGKFINYVCNTERSKGVDIFHDGNGQTLMPEIDRSNDVTLSSLEDIPLTYSQYYFCGFHYGNCIHRRLDRMSRLIETDKIGAVFNLSMIVHDFEYKRVQENMQRYRNYLWTHSGYLPVNISI